MSPLLFYILACGDPFEFGFKYKSSSNTLRSAIEQSSPARDTSCLICSTPSDGLSSPNQTEPGSSLAKFDRLGRESSLAPFPLSTSLRQQKRTPKQTTPSSHMDPTRRSRRTVRRLDIDQGVNEVARSNPLEPLRLHYPTWSDDMYALVTRNSSGTSSEVTRIKSDTDTRKSSKTQLMDIRKGSEERAATNERFLKAVTNASLMTSTVSHLHRAVSLASIHAKQTNRRYSALRKENDDKHILLRSEQFLLFNTTSLSDNQFSVIPFNPVQTVNKQRATSGSNLEKTKGNYWLTVTSEVSGARPETSTMPTADRPESDWTVPLDSEIEPVPREHWTASSAASMASRPARPMTTFRHLPPKQFVETKPAGLKTNALSKNALPYDDSEEARDVDKDLTTESKVLPGEVLGLGMYSKPKRSAAEKLVVKLQDADMETKRANNLRCIALFLAGHKYYGFDPRKGTELSWKYSRRVFYLHFPRPRLKNLEKSLYNACSRGVKFCIDEVADVARRSYALQNTGCLHDPFLHQFNTTYPFQTALELFRFRTTASYYLCWYTLLKREELKTIHAFSTASVDKRKCLAGLELVEEPFEKDRQIIDFRTNALPFTCAQVAFCPDPCYGRRTKGHVIDENFYLRDPGNPCRILKNKECSWDTNNNHNFLDLQRNRFNVTCKCTEEYPGFEWNSRFKLCIDKDECAKGEFQCPDRKVCYNTVGSYRCLCSRGYVLSDYTKKCHEKVPLPRAGNLSSVLKTEFEEESDTFLRRSMEMMFGLSSAESIVCAWLSEIFRGLFPLFVFWHLA